jgi:hypothetical protein
MLCEEFGFNLAQEFYWWNPSKLLITFDPDYRVHISETRISELRQAGLDGKLRDFRSSLREVIRLPAELPHRPRPDFVERANTLRGWKL